jgi:thiamine pyrophosphokinase
MITDTGIFRPFLKSSDIKSYPGQQVSIFSIDSDTAITSQGLLYPLNETKLKNWWCGTLNESVNDVFSLHFKHGRIIVYMKF